MTETIHFKLGQASIAWRPDRPVEVLTSAATPLPGNANAELRRRLANPNAGPSLPHFLRGHSGVVIVVSDATRAVGYRVWLPALLDAINACGIPDTAIELLVAVGLHEPEAPALTEANLGPAVNRVTVSQHRCRDAADLALVRLANGAAVRVNCRLVEAPPGRAVILTGSIVFHYHAGFGGGRKAVFPGCAAYDDVVANHKRLLDPTGPRGRNPLCQPGRLDGNPIYDESVAVMKACPPMFLVNSVLTAAGEIAAFFTGDPIEAHRQGCQFVHHHFTAEIGAPADLVIAGAGGAPKDGSLYQAHKAYDNAARAVRSGGAMIFLAALPGGLGGPAFQRGLDYPTLEAHRAALFGDGYSIPSQTCLACREKAARAKTWIVGPSADLHADLQRVGFHPAAALDQAISQAHAYLAQTAIRTATLRTLLLPNAGQVLPVVDGQVVPL